jgi:hypothetical protein
MKRFAIFATVMLAGSLSGAGVPPVKLCVSHADFPGMGKMPPDITSWKAKAAFITPALAARRRGGGTKASALMLRAIRWATREAGADVAPDGPR